MGCMAENILTDAADDPNLGCFQGTISEVAAYSINWTPDGFSTESSYEIHAGPGGPTVASGGHMAEVQTVNLIPGDVYCVQFFDTFGDGWQCGGSGGLVCYGVWCRRKCRF